MKTLFDLQMQFKTEHHNHFCALLGYLLDSGDPYILWSTEAAFSVPPMMDLYGTGSMATACCTSR